VDGERGLGPVVAMAALDAIIPRAQEDGIAIAAIRNANHLGALAYYAEHVASLGLTCIALTVSEALVHPWGGRKAMIGTNPIAIGVPAAPHPMVLDMATGLVSMGKIHAGREWRSHHRRHRRQEGRHCAVRRAQGLCAGHRL
jgi:L-2-hydroxycarboxylate dehydrogenase (NAD+)